MSKIKNELDIFKAIIEHAQSIDVPAQLFKQAMVRMIVGIMVEDGIDRLEGFYNDGDSLRKITISLETTITFKEGRINND